MRLEELEPRTLLSVFTPAQVRQAYGFNQVAFTSQGRAVAADGSGQTIALVDAYDDPNVVKDLQAFDRAFGLPGASLTKATPQGLPPVDPGWAQEISLDVQWTHAIAPGARILLVEAKSGSVSDLVQAVDYARSQPGVVAVSMSWAVAEFAGEAAYDSHFTTPSGHLGGSSGLAGAPYLKGGITFVAAAGDTGSAAGPQWPSVSPNVLGVGGTTLVLDSKGNYAGETAWSGGGGGRSTGESEPYFQRGVQRSGAREAPDVAYAADPRSSFYVYDSVPVDGYAGWYSMGGTSAGAPQWAALVAIADQGRALAGKGSLDGATQTLYALYKMAATSYTTYFHDVTSGGSGVPTQHGYDMVTGLGSPVANQVVAALQNVAGSYGGVTLAARTATTKPPPPKPVTRSVLATPVAPPVTATPGGTRSHPAAPQTPATPAAAAAPAPQPSSTSSFLSVVPSIPVFPGVPRVALPLTTPAVLGNGVPASVAPRPLPGRAAPSIPLESGGDTGLPILDNQRDSAEPEMEEPPATGPAVLPPPADPGDPAPDEEDGPGPSCAAAGVARDTWLVALAPAATALWERMDAAPWALCSLAVPAGLGLVVGSCAADPSGWEEETDELRSRLWRWGV
jgi:hypothetical protein